MGPSVGDRAPDFELAGTGGRSYRLSEERGREVILIFYPADFSPVCTRQLCAYRDGMEALEGLDAAIFGISPQSIDTHERFVDRHSITFPLLYDADLEVARSYGVKLGPIARRALIVVDAAGLIGYRHVSLLGLTYRDVDEIVRAVELTRGRAAGGDVEL